MDTISPLWISPKVGGPLYPRCEYPQKSVDHYIPLRISPKVGGSLYPKMNIPVYCIVHNDCTATDNLLKWSILINNEEICTDKQTNKQQTFLSARIRSTLWISAVQYVYSLFYLLRIPFTSTIAVDFSIEWQICGDEGRFGLPRTTAVS